METRYCIIPKPEHRSITTYANWFDKADSVCLNMLGKIVSDYIILKEDAQGVRMFVPTAYDYHQMLKELENF
jgi:hypothetical protein